MEITKNKFKKIYPSTRTQFGCWNGLVDTNVAEIIAGAGFDWILIDGEHAPFDLRTIQHQLQALAQFDVPVLVRPAHGDPHLIKQLMDIGVQTLLVPMVETAEQASEMYQAMQYPPIGTRGVGTALARAAQWNGVNNYYQNAGAEMCLIVQVESVLGVQNLDAILATAGVEGVFIGPADLAASMGYLGQPEHLEVQKVIESIIKVTRKAGKISGIMAVAKPMADHYAALGANMICIAIDTLLLSNAAKQAMRNYVQGVDNQSNTRY
jgi:4-hydroxy-2-oxoheptanedioate aldolase